MVWTFLVFLPGTKWEKGNFNSKNNNLFLGLKDTEHQNTTEHKSMSKTIMWDSAVTEGDTFFEETKKCYNKLSEVQTCWFGLQTDKESLVFKLI